MNIMSTPQNTVPNGPNAIRALVLDDDDFDRRRLSRMSNATGLSLQVDAVGTIDAMREMLDASRYDVIFLDYWLAQDTGLDALAIIHDHAHNGDAATVMVTGNAKPELLVTAYKAGCRDVLRKEELNPDVLKASVLSVLPRRPEVSPMFAVKPAEVDRALVDLARDKLPQLLVEVLSTPKVQSALNAHFDASIGDAVSKAFEVYWGASSDISEKDLALLLEDSLGTDSA